MIQRSRPVATHPDNFSEAENRACQDSVASLKKVNCIYDLENNYFAVGGGVPTGGIGGLVGGF